MGCRDTLRADGIRTAGFLFSARPGAYSSARCGLPPAAVRGAHGGPGCRSRPPGGCSSGRAARPGPPTGCCRARQPARTPCPPARTHPAPRPPAPVPRPPAPVPRPPAPTPAASPLRRQRRPACSRNARS
ncbi:hypothetical protein B7R87_16985 [Streptomyces tsukubensis]|uniref:Uncharacterized protein n=1 Tax=Streptomyces tsukubensis (strain DSM 42081 / NBRC 108919 / NRRL 18488 / 9993) TaxID=1114943 RepID=A0A7G3UH04_STRT9|nr:hypothetical protein B7R87_16985 [Streptomyces tsukubensis]QKM68589.1 hypothetical protein STSU_016805 [Streptomyces tsukubensis NRRL18488]